MTAKPDDVEARVLEEPTMEDVREQNQLLREQNALLKRLLTAVTEQARTGPPSQPRSFVDYIGQALVGGKFDPLIGEVQESLKRSMGEGLGEVPAPPRRRRR